MVTRIGKGMIKADERVQETEDDDAAEDCTEEATREKRIIFMRKRNLYLNYRSTGHWAVQTKADHAERAVQKQLYSSKMNIVVSEPQHTFNDVPNTDAFVNLKRSEARAHILVRQTPNAKEQAPESIHVLLDTRALSVSSRQIACFWE
ncbi:unnamed protein product [Haemonchus placei]|uniref:RanBD1 domain-containing protein n=1 Tax=Haemonchus placei TaxID=6290 RepID=A0A0N4WY12_HAEPC|nr:unnamed protein product [Haemonchus placei]